DRRYAPMAHRRSPRWSLKARVATRAFAFRRAPRSSRQMVVANKSTGDRHAGPPLPPFPLHPPAGASCRYDNGAISRGDKIWGGHALFTAFARILTPADPLFSHEKTDLDSNY